MDREIMVDAIENAIDRVHDLDVTFRQYAESVADDVMPLAEALEAVLLLHSAHHNHPVHAAGRAALAKFTD